MNWRNLTLSGIPRDAAADAAAAAAAAAAEKPWYDGKADAETIGHWENKGWKKEDPAAIAIEATKQARELQKHFGVPADQLIKLPKDASDEAGWKSVYNRLGVPADAKEYTFDGIKHADGTDPAQALTDAIRAAALSARVPKDRAGEILKAAVKHLDDARAADAADFTAKLTEEKTALAKNWGITPDKLDGHQNMLLAKLGAQRLGIAPEAIAALEKTVGYAAVMDAMRKIGAGTSEDTFHEGGGGNKQAMTLDGAKARKDELMNDNAWQKRYLDGEAAAVREMSALNAMIAGAA